MSVPLHCYATTVKITEKTEVALLDLVIVEALT